MRIHNLYVKDFKNLKEFRLTLDNVFTTVLVGPNATGKSNVLEALIFIFRDLDLGQPPQFAYTIEYECRKSNVLIDADPQRSRNQVLIHVNGDVISAREFASIGRSEYLPSFLFGYYSGASDRMERHFSRHQKIFADDLLHGVDQPLRPLLYARSVHGQFALLSFFQREDQDRSILNSSLRILDLESVLFVLRRPDWYNPQRREPDDSRGDPRFWGARGVVRDFLDRLYKLALAPLRSRATDRLYLFLRDKNDLMRLAEEYDDQAEFFKALESLYISDLIADVRSNVLVQGSDNALTFRELSEGEQQLLLVLGLLRFIDTREGLILLDEPDTHLNPAWSLRYTRFLRDHVIDPLSTQIVMATHDPLVVAGLTAPEVRIMQRLNSGRVTASPPEDDPKGMGIDGLLTSDVYGLRAALDLDSLEALDRKRELALLETLNEEQRRELAELTETVGRIDLITSVRDPMYAPFVEAMGRLERQLGLQRADLSPEQQALRKRVAEEVIATLAERMGSRPEVRS